METLLQYLCFLLLGSFFREIWSKPSESAVTTTQNMNNGRPQSCSAKVLNSSSVLLTWKLPFGGESFGNDYWIYYRPLYSKGNFSKLHVGPQLEFTVNGLYCITYYAFRIVTKDSTGKLSFCEVLAKTARDARFYIPLRTSRENKTALAFTWRPVNLQDVLVKYRLYMEGDNSGVPRVSLLYEGPETRCVIQSDKLLFPSRFYVSVTVGSLLQITIQAAYKPTYETKTALMPLSVGSTTTRPAQTAFINVTNDARGWKFVKLSWNPLTSGKNQVMYRLSYRSGSSFKEEMTSKSTALISGLEQLTEYTITVHAEQENGTHIFASTEVVVSTLDRNECKEIPGACSKPSECVNSRGSYFCRCPQGWTADGKVCKEWPKNKANVSFCDSVVYVNITWQKTLQGQTALALCPLGSRGVARRQCLDPVPGDLPRWAVPDLSDCISDKMANIAQQLEDPDVDLSSIAKQLVNATDIVPDAQGTLQTGDLKIVTGVIEKISQKSFGDLQGKVQTIAESVVRTSSNILDSRTLELWKFMPKESMTNEATKLLEGLDKIALHLAKSGILDQTIVSETPNVVLSVKSTNDTSPTDQQMPLSVMRNETLSSIVLPGSVLMLQRGKHNQSTFHYVTFVSYRNLNELMQPHVKLRSSVQTNPGRREDSIESEIVSVSISPMEKNVFDDPVTLILRNSKHPTEREAHCVFWNISSPRGFWSKTGCKLVKQNSSHTVCQCYHLTSFAVLMRTRNIQESPVMKHQSVLSLVSFIGISISIVALFICFLTFTFLRFRNVRLRYFVHANLAFSLCLAETLFLFGINKTQNQLVCKLIAVTLHYLFLVSFCWMALEGVVLYLLLVKIFHSKNRPSRDRAMFLLCGWGIPAVVVSVCAGFFHQGYGTEAFCWLSLERHFTWAFVAPVLLICLFNCICLGRIFIVMANSRRVAQNETRIQQIRYWSRGCALLSCLLGLTWILGVFVINEETIFMAYLFNIFNTLQGLLIFLFHCIGDEMVRAEYLRILCCQSRAKSHGAPRPWWSKSDSLSRSRTWEDKNARTRRSTLQSTTEYAKTTAERMASRKASNTEDHRGATIQGSIDRPLEINMLYGITEDTHAEETSRAEVDVQRVNDCKHFKEQESDQPPTYEPVCDKELKTPSQRKKHSDGDSSQPRFPDVTHQGGTDAESTL